MTRIRVAVVAVAVLGRRRVVPAVQLRAGKNPVQPAELIAHVGVLPGPVQAREDADQCRHLNGGTTQCQRDGAGETRKAGIKDVKAVDIQKVQTLCRVVHGV